MFIWIHVWIHVNTCLSYECMFINKLLGYFGPLVKYALKTLFKRNSVSCFSWNGFKVAANLVSDLYLNIFRFCIRTLYPHHGLKYKSVSYIKTVIVNILLANSVFVNKLLCIRQC